MKFGILLFVSLLANSSHATADRILKSPAVALNYFKEGSISSNKHESLHDVYFQDGELIEKSKVAQDRLACNVYKNFGNPGHITTITAYISENKLNRKMSVHAYFSGYGFSIFCDQTAKKVEMMTFADIERTTGGALSFDIVQDELADPTYFSKWFTHENIFLTALDNTPWPKGTQPKCAYLQSGAYRTVDDCFFSASPFKTPLVKLDFLFMCTTCYHRLQLNHRYVARSLFVKFKIHEQVFSNRPGFRENSVSFTWFDQVGYAPNSYSFTYSSDLYAPENSRTSPSIDDFRNHLGKSFEVIEQ